MEICVKSFDGEKYTVEVGVDDTTADIRRKVATAAELREDGFDMSFGGKLLAEGDDTTQLSAGDTVVLTKTKSQKDDAIAALRDLGETWLTPPVFNGLTDPKLIHLFLQAEVVTEILYGYLQGGTFEVLDLSGATGVTRVSSHVLAHCNALHTIDLSGWYNVTHIEGFFLDSCNALHTVDLSGWRNVTQIEDFFLANCPALQTLNMTGWSNVTQVGEAFLFNCSALKTLNLSGWESVQNIEKGFLKGCKIRNSSINVAGSSRVVSEYVKSRSFRGKCVCM